MVPPRNKNASLADKHTMDSAERCVLLENTFAGHSSGAKAQNLGEIIRLGIAVPRGFVLTGHVLEEFLQDHQLNPSALFIDKIPEPEVLQCAHEMQARIKEIKISDNLLAAITLCLKNVIGNKAVIVRSSAIGEDSAEASFAGQLDSVVVKDIETELEGAILNCWASYWHKHTISYQVNRNCFLQGMGLVIQELVDSTISGVLFTEYPTGQTQQEASKDLLAEFCFGLGERLVSGAITPGRIRIARDGSRWEVIAQPVEGDLSGSQETFDFRWVSQLAAYAHRLEQHWGCPQDIEWTVDQSGNLFILQSRPVTVKQARKFVWSNANMNENYPDPVCPLLGSIAERSYYHYFRNLGKSFGIPERYLRRADAALSNTVGIQAGRLYYNLTNIYRTIRLLPFSGELIEGWDSFIGIYENLEEEQDKQPLRLSLFSKSKFFLQVVVKTIWSFSFISLRVRKFVDDVDEHVRRYGESQNLSRENSRRNRSFEEDKERIELKMAFESFLTIRFHRWKNASLADAAALITYRLLSRTLGRWIPKESGIRQNVLLKGSPNMISVKPAQKLWELSNYVKRSSGLRRIFRSSARKILNIIRTDSRYSEFNERLEEYLTNWGFRRSGELLLTTSNFQEEPDRLIALMKKYVESSAPEPNEQLKRQSVLHAEEMERVILELAKENGKILFLFKKWLLLAVLRMTHKSIFYREWVRFKQAELYGTFRQTILGLGNLMSNDHLIDCKEDIFYLKYSEIRNALDKPATSNHDKLRATIDARRVKHEQHLQMNPPTTLILKEDEYFENAPISLDNDPTDKHSPDESYFSGIPVSPGRVRGSAKKLSSVFESDKINPGEILVTKQTDPGWGPIFPLIKGLVLERGGMLSHGAIIAREFGIPAVVDVGAAIDRIGNDEIILVDGDHGKVSY